MIVRLMEPTAASCACNWLLQAEGLRDPVGWTRFLPFHSTDSDRFRFDTTVRELHPGVKVLLRKNLLDEGVSIFEYDWSVAEDVVLEHAMQVAESLGTELVLGRSTRQAA